MEKVLKLRSERSKINDRVQALAKIEAEEGQLNAEQLAEFANLQSSFDDLTARIERAEAVERMNASSAVPLEETAKVATQQSHTPIYATPKAPEVKGAGIAKMVLALGAAQGDNRRAAQIATERGYGADIAASLNTLSSSAGGILVPTNLATEVIELLRPKSVVRKMGTRALPLNNGNITIPRLKGGAVVGYVGVDTDIPTTQQEFADLKLSSKKLAALVPISNDLLAVSSSSPNVDGIVVGDLTSAIALREDKAFIRDDGTADNPKGLRFWAIPQNIIKSTVSEPNIQQVATALNTLVLRLEAADSNMLSVGWVMHPRTKRFLASLRDGNGNVVYPSLENNVLMGYPVGVTTQIPTNLTVGDGAEAIANGSEIYLADFGDCFIAEDASLTIDYSKEATYKNSNGDVISAFQRDQTLIRVIAKHDFGPRHVESIAILTSVQWGSGFMD